MEFTKKALNLLPPCATIVLAFLFLFNNPYSSMPPNPSTTLIVLALLVFPALLAAAAVLFEQRWMKVAGFLLSLPLGLYLGLARFPNVWCLFLLFIVLYLFAEAQPARLPGR